MIDETMRRVLDDDGRAIAAAPEVPAEDLRRLYRHMLTMRLMDQRMLSLQRQGRIGFYGLTTGQEASVAGSAYPLKATDWVFPALRETGVSLWRGTTLEALICQLIGNSADVLLGRGHVGDGVIDFGPISAAVAAAGYRGYVEVEIFNADVWAAPPDRTAAVVRERFAAVLGEAAAAATQDGCNGARRTCPG